MVSFVTQMREWPSEIRIVHGNTAAKIALSECYKAHYRQVNCHVEVKIPSRPRQQKPQSGSEKWGGLLIRSELSGRASLSSVIYWRAVTYSVGSNQLQ